MRKPVAIFGSRIRIGISPMRDCARFETLACARHRALPLARSSSLVGGSVGTFRGPCGGRRAAVLVVAVGFFWSGCRRALGQSSFSAMPPRGRSQRRRGRVRQASTVWISLRLPFHRVNTAWPAAARARGGSMARGAALVLAIVAAMLVTASTLSPPCGRPRVDLPSPRPACCSALGHPSLLSYGHRRWLDV